MTPTQILRADVDALRLTVTNLVERIDKLVPVGPERNLAVASPTIELPSAIIKELGESDPVPALYRDTVSQVLNKNFGVHSKAAPDAAQFSLTIVVPDKYSSLTPEQKALQHSDLRLKVISYAEGVNGVKEWAELVYKNFNPDIQAMITADRLSTK